MKTFPEYLSDFTRSLGLENDRQLSLHLGVTPQYVWKMRHEGRAPDELCLEMARVLEVEPGLMLIARNAAKEPGAVGDAWKNILGRVAVISSLVVAAQAIEQVELPNIGEGDFSLKNQGVTTTKDYRKYRITQSIQRLAREFLSLFPVIHSLVKPQHSTP